MKKTVGVILAAIGLMGASTRAETVTLSQKEVILNVDISTTKLKRSSAGYDSPVVKVLVPELADVTLLDHRNTGEGAPCLSTYMTNSPQDIIQNNPAVEKTTFTVTLQKELFPNLTEKTCEVSLIEKVEGNIRGFKFQHERDLVIGSRHIDDCR